MSVLNDLAPLALSLRGLDKSFGSVHVTQKLDLDLRRGEIHALIGPNGAGKSTLISQIAGELAPDSGQVLLDGRDVTHLPAWARPRLGLARAFQVSQLYLEFTVQINVAIAIAATSGKTYGMWRSLRSDQPLLDEALAYLQKVGLAARTASPVSELSHGERRQLEIAMALAQEASVLLLDEPMAGMGGDESAQMTRLIAGLKGRYSVLLVEHDMDAVFALADRITVLVHGRAVITGTVSEIRGNALVREAYLGGDDA